MDVVRYLVEHGANMEIKDIDGRPALMLAACNFRMAVVRYLVEHGADVDANSKSGQNALIRAATDGELEMVQYLAKQGANVDAKNNNGENALKFATKNGHLDVMGYLVEHGADTGDNHSWITLFLAARDGKLEVVRQFVNENDPYISQSSDGLTALMSAASGGHVDVLQYLVEQGADPDIKSNNGWTALMFAADKGHVDAVRYLVESGVDKDATSSNGSTAVTLAVSGGHLEVTRYLVQQGVDKGENDTWITLFLGASDGQLDVVQGIVKEDAEKATKAMFGFTALMFAARGGRTTVIRYLVEQSADKDATSNSGETALVFAASGGHMAVVRYLVEQGADKDIKSNNGQTALMIAANDGRLVMVRYLVERGADKDTKDQNGSTVLLCAASHGHVDVVLYLLERGADGLSVDSEATTVLLHLLMCNDADEAKLLPVAKTLFECGLSPLQSNKHGQSIKLIALQKNFHGILALLEEYTSKSQLAAVVQREPEPEDHSWFIPQEDIVKTDANSIAEGGFGSVYRAKWAYIDVVVKEPSVVEMRRFLKEVNVWYGLRHRNVVPFYGATHRQEPFFIVSMYASNGELGPYLKREKAEGRKVTWRKLQEVAAGLYYLHQRGIVHGDLKGNNIVVSSDGTAMLMDFGLSFIESESCSVVMGVKDSLGAMAWRAPEYANMTVMAPTRKADVYSLGMCIIEALTGSKPWSGYTNEEIRWFLREGKVRVERPSTEVMSYAQWQLVERMISPSPSDRPELSAVLSELEVFAEEESEMEDFELCPY